MATANGILLPFLLSKCKNFAFFYLIDFDYDECLKNVFWIDAKLRVIVGYFDDVITFDMTYLTNRLLILSVGRLIIESLMEENIECSMNSYARDYEMTPNEVITNINTLEILEGNCMIENEIIAEPSTMERMDRHFIVDNVTFEDEIVEQCKVIGSVEDYIPKVGMEFETEKEAHAFYNYYAMKERFDIKIKSSHKLVSVYLKYTFYAGMSPTQRSESMNAFFDKYVNSQTYLKEFVDKYEMALKDKYEKEIKIDFESFNGCPVLTTECCFEIQLSKVNTKGIFKKFQREDQVMRLCV
ncbi:hypothetical protein HHK36_021822 [Tetracentron sinense]|uniref:Protein FAR1-RELATED SEQUENCE n=1 Tax=Tetracentron sinense TaxID=13715 RepID=A0A834YVV5_TETSI|nr:hypothetical protein HHK36_021822 [Tetracentron sinense]